jgi:NADP-dependent aldehyde dehydrogenase
MELTGRSLIGGVAAAAGGTTFHALNPATGEVLAPAFHAAEPKDVDRAASLAAEAAAAMARLSGADRARYLREIAARITDATPSLVARAAAETALTDARLSGEVGRTTGQLRLFADLVERGDWVSARIETADPARRPTPKPDHRSMARAIGPVVVFGSSNFPFAFSVAGGDAVSAFAAGNPVLVKAHPSHPGTSELVGRHVDAAARACGLPPGAFSLLFDGGFEVGQALVMHPAVRAVGFTGSRRGGRALMDLAARRPEPIPVYAEMGSVNPVFLLPGAIAGRGGEIAAALHASITLGVGQFCTSPGLLVLLEDAAGWRFLEELAGRLAGTAAQPMLNPGIHAAYIEAVARRASDPELRPLAGVRRDPRTPAAGGGPCAAAPSLFACDAAGFLRDAALSEEVFGPSALAILCSSGAQLFEVARHIEGNLTATIHAEGADLEDAGNLIEILASRVGRVLVNGVPTGVEVTPAMVHGGPYPASSDGRSTSVGTHAIHRFSRLVCYQDVPDQALPPELQDANPGCILRLLNGEWTRAPAVRPAGGSG